MEHNGVRPKTGKLLVGGRIFTKKGHIQVLPVNGSVHGSWLMEERPEDYLFSRHDFLKGKNDLRDTFMARAAHSSFRSIIFDYPSNTLDNMLMEQRHITVLYLPEGQPWKTAKILTRLSLGRDLAIGYTINTKPEDIAWRKWDKKWLWERVLHAILEIMRNVKDVRGVKKKSGTRDLLKEYGAMYSDIENQL